MIRAHALKSVYWVPADHPAPGQAARRLDDIASRKLAGALGAAVPAALGEDAAICMIRKLALHFEVGSDLTDDAIAGEWAKQIAAAIAKNLGREDDDEFIRFPDRAALLGRYFADLAAGRTGRWFYQAFEGLALLPPSGQIRTLLTEDIHSGVDALVRLSPASLAAVLGNLTEFDARHVIEAIESAVPVLDVPRGVLRLCHAWMAEGRPAPDFDGELCWALRLGVAAVRARGEMPFEWPAAGPALARLLLLARIDRRGLPGLIGIIAAGPAAVAAELSPGDAAVLTPLCACPRALLESFHTRPTDPKREEPREWRRTAFGGVFLLLPILAQLADFEPPGWWLVSILLRALGGARAHSALHDPVVRDLFAFTARDPEFAAWLRGLPEAPRRDALAAAEAALARDNRHRNHPADALYVRLPEALGGAEPFGEAIAALVLRYFSWRLPGFASASFGHLYDAFLSGEATVEQRPGRMVVRLGACPLAVLLNMTGMSRQQYRLPWNDGCTVELFPEP